MKNEGVNDMVDEYPDKSVCGLYGMYIKDLIDNVSKPGYPQEMMRTLGELRNSLRDMTYESCLSDDLLSELINRVDTAYTNPTKENIDDIMSPVYDEIVSTFSEETQPGYTPGRKTGSNRRV